jgi:hypothetical protein
MSLLSICTVCTLSVQVLLEKQTIMTACVSDNNKINHCVRCVFVFWNQGGIRLNYRGKNTH